jgi:thiol:disulfide interchange protein DsbD
LLWGVLAIASGVYMGALGGAAGALSGWQRLWRALGLVLVLVGAIEIVGAMSGGNDWTRPLKQLGSAAAARGPEHGAFQRVKSLQDVKAAVARAARAGKPVMLDFYADWCVECLRMQRNTFPQQKVRSLMARFKLLQADVTGNDAVDRQLLAEYGIIGPPAILFFDRHGKELRSYRLIGYAGPRAFSEHLQRMLELP